MIHPVLFKREAKANWRLLVIFLAVLTMYGVTIVTMFDPELGESLTAWRTDAHALRGLRY
jgi:ABC-2 type transport system permease protein